MLRRFFNKILKLILITFALLITTFIVYMAYRFVAGQYNHYVFNKRIQGGVERGGTKYYISPNGNDANNGTSQTNAWKTIEKVNQIEFKPGDEILFESGKTFEGNLSFDSNDVGTPINPILIATYGNEQATIAAGDGNGLLVQNSMGFDISNLNFVGSGQKINQNSGIVFINDLVGEIKLDTVRIRSVRAQGFGGHGILFWGNNGKSGFRNILIENSESHDNRVSGVYVLGSYSITSGKYAHENVVVRSVKAYKNSGIPGLKRQNTGSGIVLSDVDGGLIERSVAYENGWLCDSKQGGPVGIWAWDVNNVVIQHNESFDNRTGGKSDGGGFDLDGGARNSVMQYNYSHGNDGAGFLVMQFTNGRLQTSNVVRYNISRNDGQKNSYGGILIWGDVRDSQIYNNTVYVSDSQNQDLRLIAVRPNPDAARWQNQFPANIQIANNIFVTNVDTPIVEVVQNESSIVFQNNNYFSTDLNLQIIWAGNTYHNLPDWRANTGQERNGEKESGFAVDPLFQTIGAGNIFSDIQPPEKLRPFCLKAESPLIDVGLDITNALQIDTGKQDFYGTAIPQNKFDLGACEFTETGQKAMLGGERR